jgi:hypothetical protein
MNSWIRNSLVVLAIWCALLLLANSLGARTTEDVNHAADGHGQVQYERIRTSDGTYYDCFFVRGHGGGLDCHRV